MIRRLLFRSEAERDLDDIKDYYEKVSAKVTNNFFKEFFETLAFIEHNPDLFQVRYRGVRIAPLYRYPYGIHYRMKGNEIIIYRVLHTKRYFK